MKLKETLKSAVFILDKDEDFNKEKFKELFTKIKKFKKLPFHDVTLTMPSKYFVKFWQLNDKNNFDGCKEAQVVKDQFIIRY